MNISISFTPATDKAEDLTAIIARIYGQGAAVANVTTTIAHEDRPDVGADVDAGPSVDAGQLDASGICWDARIHSNPPKINQTGGLYRRKKGVDDLTVAAVTKELQAKGTAVAAPTPPVAMPTVPGLPAMPGLPVPPPIAPPAAPSPYASFVDWIAGHVTTGTSGVTQEWVGQALESMGVAGGSIASLVNAPAEKIAEYRTNIAAALNVPAI